MWAQAQPNIALVKYWGKQDADRNLPAVGSLSITLDTLYTRMSVDFLEKPGPDELVLNDELAGGILPRVSDCIDRIAGRRRPAARVRSVSNFPVAAGLASSSSAFAALALATYDSLGRSADTLTMARAAGSISGSAARSFYGGFVELSPVDGDIDVRSIADPDEWPLEVVVAITDSGPKRLSSGEAMIKSARTSPFYTSWVERQPDDLQSARQAIRARDFEQLAAVSEHNCLKMHSVMWASRPPIVFWNDATLACMEAVRDLQKQSEPVFFTIDAGPQLKAVCLSSAAKTVRDALAGTDGVMNTRVSGVGHGARLSEES
ncbi:MAG: diphosphomevalonate decarboxylase [Woeseia sp.]